jgi:hypothetical protein
MYGSVLPSYDSKKDKVKQGMLQEKVINADEPENKDVVRNLLFG